MDLPRLVFIDEECGNPKLGDVCMRKIVRLHCGQPGAPVNWDNFNIYLHEKFCPVLQGRKCHMVLFCV